MEKMNTSIINAKQCRVTAGPRLQGREGRAAPEGRGRAGREGDSGLHPPMPSHPSVPPPRRPPPGCEPRPAEHCAPPSQSPGAHGRPPLADTGEGGGVSKSLTVGAEQTSPSAEMSAGGLGGIGLHGQGPTLG